MYLTEQYFLEYEKYNKQYKNPIILLQVGSFFEMYSTNDKGPNLNELSKITNLTKTRKNKSISEISITNPNMIGFPCVALIKYVEILINNNYIVIVLDQQNSSNKINRCINTIYTKSTFIENMNNSTNYLMCIYLTTNKQRNNQILYSCGISLYDISINKLSVYECYSSIINENYTINEINRCITNFNPTEIILYTNEDFKCDDIIFDNIIIYKNIDPKYLKLSYQQTFLQTIYPFENSFISIFEQLDLEKSPLIIVSLLLLIDYIYDKNLIKNIANPQFIEQQDNMILENNAIIQLNIFENKQDNIKTKYKCLFDIINQTSTSLGERYLKQILISPSINKKYLNDIYDTTEYILENDINLHDLNNIKDIEKLHRKIELNNIKPNELCLLLTSYEYICKILIKTEFIDLIKEKFGLLIDKQVLNDCITEIKRLFNLDELIKYYNYDFKTNIYNNNIHNEIDNITTKILDETKYINDIKSELNSLIISSDVKQLIKVNYTIKDGYYLSLSNLKAGILKNKLNINPIILVNNNSIDTTKFTFNITGKITKIFLNLTKNNDEYDILIKKYYLNDINNIYIKYDKLFKQCNSFIAFVDYLNCNSKLKIMYNYNKPIIVNKEFGYVNAMKLRHPIIERIIDHPYIPHDIELGNTLKGMLIYGLNSAGKSSLMKQLGISIILAQSGLYVPAEKFEFSPYKSLYTRITGQDDIFKGHSSFAVEMIELNNIIQNANEFSLIIGDEICRSTENISANAIVASTIILLEQKKASFMFATHLHDLMSLDEIKNLNMVKSFHIQVKCVNNILEYNRKLLDGPGEPIYGINVANFIIKNKEFITKANDIKHKLLKDYDTLLSGKTSRYNSQLYIHKCNICGLEDKQTHISMLETHHIHQQKDSINGFNDHIKKNDLANLIVLCTSCHDKIHSGELIIQNYKFTSNGRVIQ